MHDSYQFTSREGDIVALPSHLKGVVRRVEILCGGNVKEVCVKPFAHWLKRAQLFLTGQTCFYDQDINKLVLLNRKEAR